MIDELYLQSQVRAAELLKLYGIQAMTTLNYGQIKNISLLVLVMVLLLMG